MVDHVYATDGLCEALLGFARDREPQSVTIPLSVSRAQELDPPVDLDPETPVFTHFYMPAEDSVSAVFGLDLGTPRTQGRFVSHPGGNPRLDRTDDLHEVVFVATPPWKEIRAYDRSGRRVRATVLEAAPPVENVS